MRRFARLTRDGLPCYVDPDEVGAITAYIAGTPDGFPRVRLLGENVGPIVLDGIEEPPDEVYRRLAAAGQMITAKELEEVQETLHEAVSLAGSSFRDASYTAVNAQEAARAAIAPIQAAFDKLKSTVLSALYTAEGQTAQKE